MLKILLATVVFNSIKKFTKDFFDSVHRQTYKNFDIAIFDDGLIDKKILQSYSGKIISSNQKFNSNEIRKFIIDYAIKNNYDLLVFCDADDILSTDRIEKILEKYYETNGNYGFYYNDLYLQNNKKIDFFKNKMPNRINSYEKIIECNFLGMSNTSINIKNTKNFVKIDI